MRLKDGRYECTLCGAVLDLPPEAVPLVVMRANGGEPRLRTITYGGKEIHACPIDGENTAAMA